MKFQVLAMERSYVPICAESRRLSLMRIGCESSVRTQTIASAAFGVQRQRSIGMNDYIAMRKRPTVDAIHIGACRVEMPNRILRSFLVQDISIRRWTSCNRTFRRHERRFTVLG